MVVNQPHFKLTIRYIRKKINKKLSVFFFTEKVQVNLCQKLLFLHQLTHNMSYCGLVVATISASEKDLPVIYPNGHKCSQGVYFIIVL